MQVVRISALPFTSKTFGREESRTKKHTLNNNSSAAQNDTFDRANSSCSGNQKTTQNTLFLTPEEKEKAIEGIESIKFFDPKKIVRLKGEEFSRAITILEQLDFENERINAEENFGSNIRRSYNLAEVSKDKEMAYLVIELVKRGLLFDTSYQICQGNNAKNVLRLLKIGYESENLTEVKNKDTRFAEFFVGVLNEEDKENLTLSVVNAGNPFIAKATWDADDETKVDIIYTHDKGEDSFQRMERSGDDIVESCFENDGRFFYTKGNGMEMKWQIEIIPDENGNPVSVVSIKESGTLNGAYDITSYNLSDYDENINIIEEIKSGRITGGKPLAYTTEEPDGSIVYRENIESGNYTIKRNYRKYPNDRGYDYSFKIDGDTKLDIERSFEKLSDNETKTTINGEEYYARFDDDARTITIKIDDFERTIDMQRITRRDSRLWEICKKLPVDAIFIMEEVDGWSYDNEKPRVEFDMYSATLYSGESISACLHELGHVKGALHRALIYDEDLNRIYEEEMAEFNKRYTSGSGRNYIDYFSKTSHNSQGRQNGLFEFIAEANMLFTMYSHEDMLSCRCMFLAQNFPRTMCLLAKMFK